MDGRRRQAAQIRATVRELMAVCTARTTGKRKRLGNMQCYTANVELDDALAERVATWELGCDTEKVALVPRPSALSDVMKDLLGLADAIVGLAQNMAAEGPGSPAFKPPPRQDAGDFLYGWVGQLSDATDAATALLRHVPDQCGSVSSGGAAAAAAAQQQRRVLRAVQVAVGGGGAAARRLIALELEHVQAAWRLGGRGLVDRSTRLTVIDEWVAWQLLAVRAAFDAATSSCEAAREEAVASFLSPAAVVTWLRDVAEALCELQKARGLAESRCLEVLPRVLSSLLNDPGPDCFPQHAQAILADSQLASLLPRLTAAIHSTLLASWAAPNWEGRPGAAARHAAEWRGARHALRRWVAGWQELPRLLLRPLPPAGQHVQQQQAAAQQWPELPPPFLGAAGNMAVAEAAYLSALPLGPLAMAAQQPPAGGTAAAHGAPGAAAEQGEGEGEGAADGAEEGGSHGSVSSPPSSASGASSPSGPPLLAQAGAAVLADCWACSIELITVLAAVLAMPPPPPPPQQQHPSSQVAGPEAALARAEAGAAAAAAAAAHAAASRMRQVFQLLSDSAPAVLRLCKALAGVPGGPTTMALFNRMSQCSPWQGPKWFPAMLSAWAGVCGRASAACAHGGGGAAGTAGGPAAPPPARQQQQQAEAAVRLASVLVQLLPLLPRLGHLANVGSSDGDREAGSGEAGGGGGGGACICAACRGDWRGLAVTDGQGFVGAIAAVFDGPWRKLAPEHLAPIRTCLARLHNDCCRLLHAVLALGPVDLRLLGLLAPEGGGQPKTGGEAALAGKQADAEAVTEKRGALPGGGDGGGGGGDAADGSDNGSSGNADGASGSGSADSSVDGSGCGDGGGCTRLDGLAASNLSKAAYHATRLLQRAMWAGRPKSAEDPWAVTWDRRMACALLSTTAAVAAIQPYVPSDTSSVLHDNLSARDRTRRLLFSLGDRLQEESKDEEHEEEEEEVGGEERWQEAEVEAEREGRPLGAAPEEAAVEAAAVAGLCRKLMADPEHAALLHPVLLRLLPPPPLAPAVPPQPSHRHQQGAPGEPPAATSPAAAAAAAAAPAAPQEALFRAQALSTRRCCAYLRCPHLAPEGGDGSHPARWRGKLCGRCRAVRYCCTACQAADWPEHKAACKELRRAELPADG